MISRLILIAALVLAAGPARAAPELQLRVGVIALDIAEGNAYTGVGLSFPVSEKLAITAEYATTFVEFSWNLGGGNTIQMLNYTQFGAYLDYTTGNGGWWATGRLGYVRNEADFNAGDFNENSVAVGFQFGWEAVGLGWNHTQIDDRNVNAYSLIFRFGF